MTCPLPERPTLEQLHAFAAELHAGVRSGDERALRIAGCDADPGYELPAAQRDLARHFGFGSWPRLYEHVAVIERRTWSWSAPAAHAPVADRFLRLATVSYDDNAELDLDAARGVLAAAPAVVTDLAAAAVCGDVNAVGSLLAGGTPVDMQSGPYDWTALMYLAYSRLDIGEDRTLRTAQLLLDSGADPNEGRYFLGYPTPFTVLTGVFGDGERGQPKHPHSLALARVLLATGAEANDGQTLYNRMFVPDDDFLPVLFEFGLGRGDGGPWRRRLPDLSDSPGEMLRGLLDWAVSHGQRDRVAFLAGHGVDVLTPDTDTGRTPIATALANGHRDVADVLRGFGAAKPEQTPDEAYAGAILAGDRAAVATTDPSVVTQVRAEQPGLVVWAAAQGRVTGIELLAEAGFDLDVLARGDVPVEQPWQTALHSAIEHGHDEVVMLLLRLGARRDIADARFGGTAADWARHFGHEHLLPVLDAG